MINALTVAQMPKNSKGVPTKLALKKAIEKGLINVHECDLNIGCLYQEIGTKNVLKLWDSFMYEPKFYKETEEAQAYLGTSFYYIFSSAI